MHRLYDLKDKLLDELTECGEKNLTESSLKTIDTLAHSIKNLDKVIEHCEKDGYSNYSREASYMGDSSEHYVRPDGSYRDSSYARGRGARRDSMGRYSRAEDEMRMNLEKLLNTAKDEHTKREIRKMLERM